MSRPVIGIVSYFLPAPGGDRPPAYAAGQKYISILRSVGAVPWIIPLIVDDPDTLAEIVARLDGLILTGGADIDPTQYGELRITACGPSDTDRDATEKSLLQLASDRCLPILGICRGMQMLNVAVGGSLYQDISSQVPAAISHAKSAVARDTLSHEVTIASGSRLAKILGETVVEVNSLHHQAIKEIGTNLRPVAYAPDGIIEAVEGIGDQFLLGVQWHPEELAFTHSGMNAIFAAFVSASRCS